MKNRATVSLFRRCRTVAIYQSAVALIPVTIILRKLALRGSAVAFPVFLSYPSHLRIDVP